MLKWVKYERRKKTLFTKFFKLIHLNRFPREFIRNTIRLEPMVKESAECMYLILQVAFNQLEEKEPSIAFLQSAEKGIVRVFDVNTTRFSILSRLEDTDMEIGRWNQHAITNCDGNLYVLVNEKLFRLDAGSNWVSLRPSPEKTGCGFLKMASLRGDIFVFVAGTTMIKYHPAGNDWTTDLPGYGVDTSFCFVSSEKYLFAMGGIHNGKIANSVKKFDQKNRNWYTMRTMLAGRAAASAAMLCGMIVVAGGSDGTKFLNSVECYNSLTRSWSELKNMNSCHTDLTLVSISGKLYACGGDIADDSRRKYKDKGTIEVFDADDENWITWKEEEFLVGVVKACDYG